MNIQVDFFHNLQQNEKKMENLIQTDATFEYDYVKKVPHTTLHSLLSVLNVKLHTVLTHRSISPEAHGEKTFFSKNCFYSST